MVLAVGVAVLIALLVVLLIGGAHRTESNTLGQLSRATTRQDQGIWVEPLTYREPEAGVGGVLPAHSGELSPWVPPSEESLGVTRRRFLNRGIVTVFGVSLAALGGEFLGFLWPAAKGGFGSKVHVGRADIESGLTRGHGFFYVPEGRMWITAYPSTALSKAHKVYAPAVLTGMEAGYVFLYQKCPHLGCRVPSCTTSQWFECPCHGSKYNRVGEKKAGPAPRGMDRFVVSPTGSGFVVDTGQIILGPPIGTNTTGQEAEGPHCIGGSAKA